MAAWLHETRTSIVGIVAVVVFLSAGSELYCSPSSSRMRDLCLVLPAVFFRSGTEDH